MKRISILLIATVLLFSNNIVGQSKKELKKQKQKEEYLETKKLIESGQFLFEADWATAQRGQRRSIAAEGYFLKIDGKSTSADLPFYGIAHSAPYGGAGGIEFENLGAEYEVDYNDKKNKIVIQFKAKHQSESFDVYISIFSNGSTDVRISSSNRDSMSYSGKVKEIPSKKEE